MPSNTKIYNLRNIIKFLAAKNKDDQLENIWIKADVADNKAPTGSDTYYFSLKDNDEEDSTTYFLKAVYFRCPKDTQVLLSKGGAFNFYGSVCFYERASSLQFIVKDCEKIQEKKDLYALNKEILLQENLIGANQLQIKEFPKEIAIITAEGHDAIVDFVVHLRKQNPLVNYKHYPCKVQGEGAPQSIIEAIAKACKNPDTELIIIGRGGGSVEDLQPFNDIELCRYIAKINIPTISAVGHTKNKVLTDEVATVSAETPTAAASYAIININDRANQVNSYLDNIINFIERKIALLTNNLLKEKNKLLSLSPQNKLTAKYNNLNETKHNLKTSLNKVINNYYNNLKTFEYYNNKALTNILNNKASDLYDYQNIINKDLANIFSNKEKMITDTRSILIGAIKSLYYNRKNAFTALKNELDANNPHRIFKMGYAKLKDLTNRDLSSVNDFKIDNEFYSYLNDGRVKSKVVEINKYKGNDDNDI